MGDRYQIDYGSGYEEVPPDDAFGPDRVGAAVWLAEVEREGVACRARVLSGGRVVEERDFGCAILESLTGPGGVTRHLVRCAGGEVFVEERTDGALSGEACDDYVGDANLALARAFVAVRALRS